MTKKQLVQEKISDFVKELEGIYKEHVSDRFLEAYLIREFEHEYIAERKNRPTDRKIYLQNLAYKCSCPLFESLLEYGCSVHINGHHIAQRFANKFEGIQFEGNIHNEYNPE